MPAERKADVPTLTPQQIGELCRFVAELKKIRAGGLPMEFGFIPRIVDGICSHQVETMTPAQLTALDDLITALEQAVTDASAGRSVGRLDPRIAPSQVC